ncbi:DUF4861 family protein [Pedobacter lithocola]|uniref:DUF4861 family protein n=1 Tax=Pedobacter lithocola TaxID=1908239 RepID=A0ABV8PD37_9SPHI
MFSKSFTNSFKFQLLAFVILSSLMSFKALKKTKISSVSVIITNSSSYNRNAETIEVPLTSLSKINGFKSNELIVKNAKTGKEVPSQVIYNGNTAPQSIIFQTNVKASSSQTFSISKGIPSIYKVKTYCRQVPERFDDFAWENDKVAFRFYGEALESQSGMAKGIDFWVKRTTDLVIDKWYKLDNYHNDNGEGVDAYHVGMTLGAGNAEPIVGDEIIFPINYSSYKVLDNGPIRVSFKLMYKPFLVNGKQVTETKIVTLDAGSQMNKITNNYKTDGDLNISIGVTKHIGDGKVRIDRSNNLVAYWDKADGKVDNGFMGVGVVVPFSKNQEFKDTKQHLLIIDKLAGRRNLTYYQGGGWSKSGNFNSEVAWFNYLENFSKQLKHPLKVLIK